MTTTTFADRSDAALAAWLETTAYALGRIAAYVIVAAMACYHAGYALGRIVHSLNDRLARASHAPVAAVTAAADAILTAAPAPSPAMAALLAGGAVLLTDEQLDRECEPSLADMFAAASAEMARSDARIYRSVGRHIAACEAILAEAEAPVRRKPAKARRVKAG